MEKKHEMGVLWFPSACRLSSFILIGLLVLLTMGCSGKQVVQEVYEFFKPEPTFSQSIRFLVFDENEDPLKDATVSANGPYEVYPKTTNEYGAAELFLNGHDSNHEYMIYISKPGYMEYSTKIDLIGLLAYRSITLRKNP